MLGYYRHVLVYLRCHYLDFVELDVQYGSFFLFCFKDSVAVLRHYVTIYKSILYNYRVVIYLDVQFEI